MVTNSIEIARRPEEVFAYIDHVDRHPEWQEKLVSSKPEMRDRCAPAAASIR